MLKNKTLPLVVLSTLLLGAAALLGGAANRVAAVEFSQKRDRVIATRTVAGKLKGFEVGDYMHAVITLNNGEEKSYFIGGPAGLDYFLVEHKDEPLVLTYQIVDSYIPEAGGRQRIERITSARAGKLTSAAWLRKMRANHSMEQLEQMYGEKVNQLRLNP